MPFLISLLTTLIAILVFFSSKKISDKRASLTVRAITLLIAIIAAISSLFKNIIVISAGNVGVTELLGRVADRPLAPGVHLTNPFTEVETFSTRLRDVKETVEATSQDGLAFNIDVSLQYRLEPQKAVEIYKTIGTDETDIVISRFRSVIREITASYPAEAIYSTKRQEVANQLRERLSEQLTPLGFVVEDALLREVKLPKTLQEAVQEKLKAEQESRQMAFTLEKERQESERKRIEAQGIADSQKLLSQGLNAQLLQLKAIEATEKFANSENAKLVIVGGGQGGLPVNIQLNSEAPVRSTSNQAQ